MKKVDLFIEYFDDIEMVYAALCVGVMDDQFIYAKLTSTDEPDPVYVQVSIADTVDCIARCQGIKSGFAAREIEVSDDDGLSDSRINTNPSISEEVKAEILAAVKESLA